MALQIQGERQKAEEVIGGTRHPARQVPSRPPFVFVHFPTNWDFDPATGGFVPGVRTVGIVAGAGGVRSNGDASTKLGYLRRKGAIVIDPTDTRLGDYRLYGTKIKNDRGRDVNMSIFERYERVGNRSFHDHDINEFRKFQSVLVDTGVIPAMHDRVKSLEIDKARAAAAKKYARPFRVTRSSRWSRASRLITRASASPSPRPPSPPRSPRGSRGNE